jgi:hypothetical protein
VQVRAPVVEHIAIVRAERDCLCEVLLGVRVVAQMRVGERKIEIHAPLARLLGDGALQKRQRIRVPTLLQQFVPNLDRRAHALSVPSGV